MFAWFFGLVVIELTKSKIKFNVKMILIKLRVMNYYQGQNSFKTILFKILF
jgi:hypothetical protein